MTERASGERSDKLADERSDRVAGERSGALARRLARFWQKAELVVARRFALATRQDRRFFLLILLVGLVAGGLGLVVTRAIEAVRWVLWGGGGDVVALAANSPWWRRLIVPALGGLLVGLLVAWGKVAAAGHGTSSLLESVALKGGHVPPRPVLLRAVAAILTVGSGGSLGREGPMIGVGAMVSSWLGARLGMPPHRLKILIGCGAAAGMAAIYKTPVGGAVFAMEVILGNFALEIFGPIVMASVVSTLLARGIEGTAPIYAAPDYVLVSRRELLLYVGLGIVGALVSVALTVGLRGASLFFARLRFLPTALRPMLGMAAVGAIAIVAPQVMGGGFDTITLALHGALPIGLLLLLPALKLVATASTAGSGGSGGLFTPALFLGALVGGAYGWGVHTLWPEWTAPYGAYAAVGMAAVAAGTSHAPISAILILFELTGNYALILPLMVAGILSTVVAKRLYRYSIYSEALQRRGVDLAYRMEEAVLAGLAVKDLTRADPDVLKPTDPYKTVVERFLGTRRQRLFVVDEEGKLLGAVSLHDIKHALDDPSAIGVVVAHDLMLPVDAVVRDDERLHRAAQIFARTDSERLPVVDAAGRLVGVLAKRDLLAVYAQEVLGRPALLATFVGGDANAGRSYVELPPDYTVRLAPLPAGLAGKTLAEARLPQTIGARVLEIKRHGRDGREERVIPDASTVLVAGDELVVLGPTDAIESLVRGAAPTPEAAAHRGID